MSRRITWAIVAMVLGTLALAGIGTIMTSRIAGRAQQLTDLRSQAAAIAELIPNLEGARTVDTTTSSPRNNPLPARTNLIDVLGISGVTQLSVTPRGRLVGTVPEWIPPESFDVNRLVAGETLSGTQGNQLWAAAGHQNPNGSTTIAVVTGAREKVLAPAIRWLMISSAVALIVGIAVALVLARQLTRPIRRAVAATQSIAAGDLSVRLETAPGKDDELASLARSINQMASELERSRSLEHHFLMSVSHDLRTPLTSICGYAEAIADGVAVSASDSARVILTEAHRLERLVGDLLDLAKLDARQFTFHPAATRVAPIVDHAVAAILPAATEANLSIHTSLAHDPTVVVDPDRLAQVIANLCSNSLKFATSAVLVRTRPQPAIGADGVPCDGVAIDVCDDGVGIEAADLPRVFERLYQARNQPANNRVIRRESGSGLGLAIVRELVDGMGGTVAVASTPGQGATFTVWLPTS